MKAEENLYFYPIDLDYEVDSSNKTITKIYGVSKDGENIIVLDSGTDPYFWIEPKDGTNIKEFAEKLKKIKGKDEEKLIAPKKISLAVKTHLNKKIKLIKFVCGFPADILVFKKIAKQMPETKAVLETDINFYKRYIIDNKLKLNCLCKAKGKKRPTNLSNVAYIFETKSVKKASSSILTFTNFVAIDLEVLPDKGFPSAEKDPIIMASIVSSTGKKKVITWKKFDNAPDYVEFVNGEEELISTFKKTIMSLRPQVIFGYNSNQFDLPYLQNRAKKYNLDLNLGWGDTDLKQTGFGINKTFYFDGIIHIDLLTFIRNILSPDLKTNQLNLDSVAKELTGVEKVKIINFIPRLKNAWKNTEPIDLSLFCEYNLRDSELTYKIGEKVFPSILQLSLSVGLPLEKISNASSWQMVEFQIMKYATSEGYVNSNRPGHTEMSDRQKKSFSGGFVFEPTAGLYSNIGSFDFRSLYPSIIVAHNIDPTTINCSCCKLHGGHKIDDNWFCSKKKGLISGLLSEIIEKKNRVSEILKKTDPKNPVYNELKAKRYALKLLSNSFYGYMGFYGARWYCFECAKSVTSMGRTYIHRIIKEANKFGFEVLYADTDGILLDFKAKNEDSAVEFIGIVNAFLTYPLQFEFDGMYKKALFVEKKSGEGGAKKKYALLDQNDNLILKGLEAIRGDWSLLAKEAQRFVIESILKTGSPVDAEKYIKKIVNDLKDRKIPLEKLKISVKLTRPLSEYKIKGPHVIAAEKAKQKGQKITTGFLTSFIIGSGESNISERVILFEDAKKEDYDIEYYLKNQLLRAVSKLFEAFGYDEEELTSGQTKLGAW